MSQHKQDKNKYTRQSSSKHIRIRSTIRSVNESPQKNNHEEGPVRHQNQREDIGSIFRKIPRTIEMHDNMLIEGCFSYVDEGFEKWKLGKIIGKGNSCVRKAMNVKKGVISAVKQIIFGSEEEEKERLAEIKILKKLDHPHIVRYLEHYRIKDETWIFMEYLPTNLRNFYLDFGPPPPQTFLKFAKQIATALAYLEKQNIIHKDIKCENILLDNDGILKLCDFGCSKDFRSTMSLKLYEQNDAIKSFRGSYLWTAPECLMGKACLASDIWSLGCSFIELASGRLPWQEKKFDNQFQAIKFIVQEVEIPKINQEWDSRIKEIIRCCLKRNPEDRISATKLLEKIALLW